MTLIEIMVATGLGSLVLLVLGSLTLYSARSFSSMVNYTDFNKNSRAALDRMSREIRQSRGLLERTATSLRFRTEGNHEVTYVYDAENKTVLEDKGDGPVPVLKNCTSWTNRMFQRTPQEGNFEFNETTDAKSCKMVWISWTCTSDSLNQKHTEEVQSMKVVIRKKPD